MTETAPEPRLTPIDEWLADPYGLREVQHRCHDADRALVEHALFGEHLGDPCERCMWLITYAGDFVREREGLRALQRLAERYGISA